MEDVIKENFCNCCINKRDENCFKLYVEENKEIKIYKCVNYKREGNPLIKDTQMADDRLLPIVRHYVIIEEEKMKQEQEKSICNECMWECKQNKKIERRGDTFIYCSKFKRKSEDEDSL